MSALAKLGSGIGWGTVSTLVMAGFQLVFAAVMARLLGPADFGLIAIANVVLRFLSYFAQMGISAAVIQKPNLDDGDIAAAFFVSLGISAVFCLLAVGASPLVSSFFAMPQLGQVVRALALSFVINGFGAVSGGLLRRRGQFRALALIDITAYLAGYGVVGLLLAYSGAGVWALVGAALSQVLLSNGLGYAVVRHPLRMTHAVQGCRHFLTFGGRYSLVGFLEFLTANLDALVIGKILGEGAAGIYNRALLLANLPVQQPANVVTRALFPVLSALGDKREKQGAGFQASVLLVGSYAFAASMGIAVAAPDVVATVLGAKWLQAIPIVQVLAFSVGPAFVSHVGGVTLDALGELRIKARLQAAVLLLLASLMLVLAPYGVVGIAAAVAIGESARALAYCFLVGRLFRVPAREWRYIVAILASFGLSAGALVLSAVRLLPADAPVALRFAAEACSGGLSLFLASWAARHLLARLPAVRDVVARLPRLARFFAPCDSGRPA